MRITLEALKVLDAIDRHESFAAAAEELHRVPSALSYSIKKLEQTLGITLFDRHEYRARLTPLGKNLLEGGRAILQQVEELEHQIKTRKLPEPTMISIAYDDFLSFELLIPTFKKILEELPEISLRISAEILNGCWDAVMTGRADIALGPSEDLPIELACEQVNADPIPFVFVVNPEHPLAKVQTPLTVNEIQSYRTILVSDTSQQLPKRSSGYIPGHLSIVVPTIHSKLQAQLAGLGVGFLPYHLAFPYIQSGQLIKKEVERSKPLSRLAIAWHPDKGGKTRQTIIQLIKQQIEKDLFAYT